MGLDLRQSCVRAGKQALIRYQRYVRARQFNRANRALRTLRTCIGRTVRDIRPRIRDEEDLEATFRWPLRQASTILEQRQRQRDRKICSLHAREAECIGKGKAHAPYEFGVKVSVATTLKRSKGGRFALHAAALPGNPYDGHTLEIIPAMEDAIGADVERILADAGYRGHNAPQSYKFRVFTAGQKRRVTPAIKPVIGHIKSEHRMERNDLAHAQGDAINAILATTGLNRPVFTGE